jgi:cytochrome P450
LPAWVPIGRRRDLAAAVRELDEVVAGIIRESRRRGDADTSLLGRLIQARDDDGIGMSQRELRDQALTLLLAGHETTALALMFAVYLLSTHAAPAQALRQELDRELGQRPIAYEDLPRLKQLDAVIKETLRLYPAAPILGRQVVTPFPLGDYAMCRGQHIIVSPYAMQRSTRHFTAPHEFRPERWLDGLLERLPRFAYFPFGGGPRVCIGNHFATMEAALLLASLVQQVTLEVPADFRMELSPVVTLRSRHGLPVRVWRRHAG